MRKIRLDPCGVVEDMCRVVRGSSYDVHARDCRSASRYWRVSDYRIDNDGFRLALEDDDGRQKEDTVGSAGER